jgi:hypothetical protein
VPVESRHLDQIQHVRELCGCVARLGRHPSVRGKCVLVVRQTKRRNRP